MKEIFAIVLGTLLAVLMIIAYYTLLDEIRGKSKKKLIALIISITLITIILYIDRSYWFR